MLATSQKEVKTLEDLKDLKIRTLNGAATTQMKALGAMPVALPMPEVYSALQNAEVEGVASPAEAICVWKLYENLKYVTNAPLPASYFTLAVNERYWNRLPAEIKEQLMSAGGYAGSQWYAEQYFGYFNETLPEIAAKNGHKLEIYTLTDDERAEWIAASAPVFDEYYNYAAKKGITAIAKSLAQELLDGSL